MTGYKWDVAGSGPSVARGVSIQETKPAMVSYLDTEIPLYGPQYGLAGLSIREEAEPREPVVSESEYNPYEDMIRDAKAEMERAYLRSLHDPDGNHSVLELKLR